MALGILQIIVVSSIFIISLTLLRQKKSRDRLNEPPLVPYKYPIIGHTFEYYKDVPGFLKKCHEEYGEIFSLYIWGTVQTYVGNEYYYEIFKNYKDFDFHEATSETFPIASFVNRPDEYFKPFLGYIKEFLQDLGDYCERAYPKLVKSLDEFIVDGKVIQPPIKTLRKVFAKPMAAGLFGEELCDDEELINTIVNITSDLGPWLSTPPFLDFIYPGLHRKYILIKFRYLDNPIKFHRKIILAKITPIIKKRLVDQNKLKSSWKRPNDIMQGFAEKLNYDIEGVADFLMATIFASTHSISLTFTQCLFDYLNHPEYHKELLEEAERVYNENKNLPYYKVDTLDKMEKLDNFIKESLRVNRLPVTFPHKTVSSLFTFPNGYQVPKGRMIQIITQQIYFDPKAFGANPENFNPSHHVKSPATRPERNFILFGTGKLLCPGRFLAIYKFKIAMHRILLKYNFKVASGKRAEPKRIGAFVFPSEEGLIFEKRKDSVIQ